ncbi:class I SAM-dependent methyltransferase [Saccharothrix sp. HUAS TT1]|uniref:class I SAM-dependent methyltransferase n=1 Tax=unclassified Saccharothrix TaxID=2593673 RepID=UPI00345C4649
MGDARVRGPRPVGVDISERRLATARAMRVEFGPDFPLVLGDAHRVPREDAAFGLAISEYGASLWCDPHRWIPEAARLLRPGGPLVLPHRSPLFALCADPGRTAAAALVRVHRRGPGRDPGARPRAPRVRRGVVRVGAAVAQRGDLEGAVDVWAGQVADVTRRSKSVITGVDIRTRLCVLFSS